MQWDALNLEAACWLELSLVGNARVGIMEKQTHTESRQPPTIQQVYFCKKRVESDEVVVVFLSCNGSSDYCLFP